MDMLAIRAISESVWNTFATCFYIMDNEVQPVQQLSSGNCLAWYLRLRNSPIALCLSVAAAGRPVCSAPRANSHQLIRCSLKKPVHTHLATLMDWSVFTFSQHLGVRVTAWPNCHIWNIWVPELQPWSSSAGTHNEVLSSLSKKSSWFILACCKKVISCLWQQWQSLLILIWALYRLAAHPIYLLLGWATVVD